VLVSREAAVLVAQLSRFGRADEVIEVVERPDPGRPGAGEVLIEAELFPINPADLENLAGNYGATPPALPMVVGTEGVGLVAMVGPGVTHVEPGDRVLLPGPGAWRQHVLCHAASVFALPTGVDPRQLAMLRVNPPTAYLLLHHYVAPEPGHWVVQNAANSGVGRLVVELARELGLKSISVVRRPQLMEPLRAAGTDLVVLDGPELAARVRDVIGDGIVPLALDAVGGSATQRLAHCLTDGGTVVNYGVLSGEPSMIDGRELIFRGVTLTGFWLRRWFAETPSDEIADLYRMLASMLADGALAVDVEEVYPLSRLKEAVAHAARGGRSGKILVSCRPG
jgi:NADPH:quinone reductase-like Zn-dependent oxidoreductase